MVLRLFDKFNAEGENKIAKKHDDEYVISSANPAVLLVSAEKALNNIATFIHFLVVFPRVNTVRFRWHNGSITQ
jgi:hypothetical protein